MNAHMLGIAFSLSLLVGVAAPAFEEVVGDSGADKDEDAVSMAADLVRAALQAEADGDADRRNGLLREALSKYPDYAPARWHSGYVRLNDRWLSLAQAESAARLDPLVAEYQQLRESLAESPAIDLQLARWCQDKKLAVKARFHWLNVLRVQPANEEALRALDSTWYNGRLLKHEQVAAQKRKDYRAAHNALNSNSTRRRRWEAMIAHWEQSASEGDSQLLATMQQDLAAEKSPGFMPLFNQLMGQRSQTPRNPEAFERVSLNWVAILAKEPAHTKFLAMHAVGHPMDAVRIAAAEELKKRPREEYVPLLLTCARFPVEFACSVLASSGLSTAQYTLDIQGLDSDVQMEHSDALYVPTNSRQPEISGSPASRAFRDGSAVQGPAHAAPVFPGAAGAAHPADWTAAAVGKAQDMKSRVLRYNLASAEINRRVTDALTRATGENVQSDPRTWQTWWKKYLCDLYELEPTTSGQSVNGQPDAGMPYPGSQPAAPPSYERRLVKYASSSSRYTLPPPPSSPAAMTFGSASCFRGSTLVSTPTGPRAIQDIRPGDEVLSQSPSTGELAYKLVKNVIRTKPTPMIRITVGGEEIVATLGHPFWVNGKRWTMAKHLQAGFLLHTVSGPLRVEKVEEIPAAEAWYEFSYNLHVAGFHTFFVGESEVLVHHLTMLSVLDEGSDKVPGL